MMASRGPFLGFPVMESTPEGKPWLRRFSWLFRRDPDMNKIMAAVQR
jgi:hypothetical protein